MEKRTFTIRIEYLQSKQEALSRLLFILCKHFGRARFLPNINLSNRLTCCIMVLQDEREVITWALSRKRFWFLSPSRMTTRIPRSSWFRSNSTKARFLRRTKGFGNSPSTARGKPANRSRLSMVSGITFSLRSFTDQAKGRKPFCFVFVNKTAGPNFYKQLTCQTA